MDHRAQLPGDLRTSSKRRVKFGILAILPGVSLPLLGVVRPRGQAARRELNKL